ncbi:MAG: nuclease-related domain-containing protein [Thioalkalispiraceae bacterium]|jgi:hypothetical protein
MDQINQFLTSQHPIVPGLILASMIALAIYLCWSPVQQLLVHWRLHSLVNKLGNASLTNVYIPDGLGEMIYIEQLLLRPSELLLVTVKPFRGNIFAAEQIDLWTQVIGHHSYKFPNPLHQQERDLQALTAVMPKLPVNGMVVFAKGSRFPKGKPDNVCDYQELKQLANEKNQQSINTSVQDAWQNLTTQAEVAEHMNQPILYRPGDKRRLVTGCVMACLAIAYTAWYLGYL